MLQRIIIFIAVISISLLFVTACKPRVSSAPGTACFSIYKLNPNNQKIKDITTAKVGEEIAVDLTCAGVCMHNYDVNWGDGYWGEYRTHKYEKPGAYSVKFECSTKSHRATSYSKKKKRYSYSSGTRYQSSKTITIAQ